MRVFVAGATGAVGKALLPKLVNAGHTVTGTTRSQERTASIRAAGATPEVVNALHAQEVLEAVQRAKPDVIVHQLTALPAKLDIRHFDREFTVTNRLRTEGTDHLLAAARAVGCRRFIAQSYGGWPYERTGGWVKTEEDPLLSSPEPAFRTTLQAIIHLESAVMSERAMEGFVLRYGSFYGPGTSLGSGGAFLEEIRRRHLPIVGEGAGYWSFLHISDAASAAVAAIEAPIPGIYNIADDEPAPVSQWLPALAEAIGAPPPRRIPVWLARLAIGALGVAMMTQGRGASNQKAKATLGWKPQWPSWRTGFREGLGSLEIPLG
ncbi:MAG TPA: NAD(P)-dependent oxidoreductase [Bryobacteraceae bacterium]|nr:NAD(P)-dependent oxidoreductase [Bryobacteraceae bacterium]